MNRFLKPHKLTTFYHYITHSAIILFCLLNIQKPPKIPFYSLSFSSKSKKENQANLDSQRFVYDRIDKKKTKCV